MEEPELRRLGLDFWNGRGMSSSKKKKEAYKRSNELMDFIGIQETQLEDSREVWMEPIASKPHFLVCFII
jgi:hypothetical protein